MPDDSEMTGGSGSGSDDQIDVGSMVSHRDGKGYVEVRWGMQHAQLSPEDARGVATLIQDAASAAETDAFLVGFLKSVGMTDEVCGMMLIQFRRYRDGEPFAKEE